MELNKEQLFLLELFNMRDKIWITNQGSCRVWNSIDFDGIWLEFSRIGAIWTRSSWLQLDDKSSHEFFLEFQIHEFLDLLQKFDSKSFENFDLVYMEFD
jgi:hypothetical protein